MAFAPASQPESTRGVLKPQIQTIIFSNEKPDVSKFIKRRGERRGGKKPPPVDLRVYDTEDQEGVSAGNDTAVFNFLQRQELVDGDGVLSKGDITPEQRTRAVEEVRRIQERANITPAERRRLVDAAMRMDPIKIARSAVMRRDEFFQEGRDSDSFLTGALMGYGQVEGEEDEDDTASNDEKFSRALEEVERVRKRLLDRASAGMERVPGALSGPSSYSPSLAHPPRQRFAPPHRSPRISPRSSPRASSVAMRRGKHFDFDASPPHAQHASPSSSARQQRFETPDIRSAVAGYLDALGDSPSADSDSKDSSSNDDSRDSSADNEVKGSRDENSTSFGIDDDFGEIYDPIRSEQNETNTKREREMKREAEKKKKRRSRHDEAKLQAMSSSEFMTEELGKMEASFAGGWDALKDNGGTNLHATARRPGETPNSMAMKTPAAALEADAKGIPRLGLLGASRPPSATSNGNHSARTDDMFSFDEMDGGDDFDASYKWAGSYEQSAEDWRGMGNLLGEASTFAADDGDEHVVRYGSVAESKDIGSGYTPGREESYIALPKYTGAETPAVLGRGRGGSTPRTEDFKGDTTSGGEVETPRYSQQSQTTNPGAVSASIQDWISFSRSTQAPSLVSLSERGTTPGLGLESVLSGVAQGESESRLTGLRDALDVLERHMVESSVQSLQSNMNGGGCVEDSVEEGEKATETRYGGGDGGDDSSSRPSSMQRSGVRIFDSNQPGFCSPIRVRRSSLRECEEPDYPVPTSTRLALVAAANAGDVAGRMIADMVVRKSAQQQSS